MNKTKATSLTFDQISSPDLRDIILNDIRKSSERGGGVLSPEAEQEMTFAKESISEFGEAERLRALPEIEKGMQRRGVLTSGDTTRRQLEKTEEVRLKEMGLLSDVQREVLGRYGGYEQAREERIYGGAETLAGIAGQKEIAKIQAKAARDIAVLEARTDLTLGEKETERERIRGKTARDVAEIEVAGRKDVAETYTGSAEYIAGAEIKSREKISAAEIESRGTIASNQIAGQMALLLANQKFNTWEGEPKWLKLFKLEEKVAINPETGNPYAVEQFEKEFDLMEASTVDPKTGLPWTRVNFLENLHYMYKELNVKEKRNTWERKVAVDTLGETIRNNNMTDERSRDQFNDTLAWAKEEFDLTDERIRDLQADAFTHEVDMLEIKNTADMAVATAQIAESARQYDISNERVIESLKLKASEIDIAEVQVHFNGIISLLESPAYSMLTDDQKKDFGNYIYDVIMEDPDALGKDPEEVWSGLPAWLRKAKRDKKKKEGEKEEEYIPPELYV